MLPSQHLVAANPTFLCDTVSQLYALWSQHYAMLLCVYLQIRC